MLVLTGAGISAESGVPTFRGSGGLWRSYRAEDLATPEAFARDPRLVWEWYGARRDAMASCEPNAAHHAIARRRPGPSALRIATQNVDGLHAAAAGIAAREAAVGGPGTTEDATSLLEIHGSLFRTRCTACGDRRDHRDPIDAATEASLPRCLACGGLLRPDVVWFGEALDPDVIGTAFEWAETADVGLVVGTSAVVQPAASLATVTLETGGAIIEVNPEPTPLTRMASVSIRGTAAGCVPAMLDPDGGR